MEDYQKAELDYINGMKYKDIAEKYGKALSTVKSWKQRYKWSKDKDVVDLKKEQKSTRTKSKSTRTKKFVDEQIELANNSDLTECEEMFCVYYAQRPNQTKAYMKAFSNNNYNASATYAYNLMKKRAIINRIRELKRGAQETALIELADIVNELKRQAFADVTDYIIYETEKVYEWEDEYNEEKKDFDQKPIIDHNTGEQAFHYKNIVRFKDASETDTTLLKSVKLNKEGHVEVETYDKQKALLELMKFMNDKTMQDARLQKLQADTDISKARANMLGGTDNSVEDAVAKLTDILMGAAKDGES